MRSKFEKRIATHLFEYGIQYQYEPDQLEYDEPLRKNRSFCAECDSTNLWRTGWYTPDFLLATGLYIETKGRFTAADRRKMIAVKEAHPDDSIVMLFMRDNKISKRSNTKYSDWCEANGYDYAIGLPKEEWFT